MQVLRRGLPRPLGPASQTLCCSAPSAAAEGDYKHKIVQRGAVPPLIDMLGNDDSQLREMAAFALGRLAQNSDNQAGIVAQGGLSPLLELLETCQSNLQVWHGPCGRRPLGWVDGRGCCMGAGLAGPGGVGLGWRLQEEPAGGAGSSLEGSSRHFLEPRRTQNHRGAPFGRPPRS